MAIADFSGNHTYQDLFDQVMEYRESTRTQIDPGDTVVILSDYNFYAISLFLMLLNRRCIIVPLVSNLHAEIDSRTQVARANKIVRIGPNGTLSVENKNQESRHALATKLIEQSKTGLILFSSGSTAEPKAMIHDLDNLVKSYREKKLRKLNLLVFLMFDHIGGLNTLLNCLSMGANLVLPTSRKPLEVASLIEKHKVQVLPTSPTFLNMLLIADAPNAYDLSSLKMITYGTEPMPESLLQRLRTSFPRTRFMQTFGTSETGISKSSSRSSDSLEIKLEGTEQEYQIVEGELWIRSKTQILGYLNSEMDNFTEDGWFRTGDLVEETKDGYIRIIGRLKEIINVGGEKVLPAEIESVLMELDFVEETAVIGSSNAITGQSVVANVVLADGTDKKVAKKKIRKHCISRISAYKVPTKINFMNQTTVSSSFKKLRRHTE